MKIDLIQLEVLKSRLSKEHTIEIKIISDSMQPLLKIDETVTVIPFEKKCEIFDLIVFWRNDKLFCHYMWRDQISFNNSVITRSLKEPYSDEKPVERIHILGTIKDKKIRLVTKLLILAKNVIKRST